MGTRAIGFAAGMSRINDILTTMEINRVLRTDLNTIVKIYTDNAASTVVLGNVPTKISNGIRISGIPKDSIRIELVPDRARVWVKEIHAGYKDSITWKTVN